MNGTIDNLISFRAPNGSLTSVLPPQLAILLLDTLEAPADFLFVHLLSKAFKQGRSCCLVTCNRDRTFYTSVLKKQGVQLNTHLKTGTCALVDASNLISLQNCATSPDDDDSPRGILERLQDQVEVAMHSFHSDQPATATPLILVDDLSTLQWSLGLDPAELSTFYRHLRSLANEENATLLSILHADSAFPAIKEGATVPDAHSDLALKQVLRLSHLWITTRSLRAQMMGELTLHRGPALGGDHPSLASMSRNRPVQYKIEETGPVIWSKGTGAGFL